MGEHDGLASHPDGGAKDSGASGRFRVPRGHPFLKKLVRTLLVFVVAFAVLIGGWILLHVARSKGEVKPLWTEADLPALPPAEENAWTVLVSRSDELKGDSLPEDLKKLLEAPTNELLLTRAGDVSSWLEKPGSLKRLFLLDEALEKPRFADACPLTVDSNCPYMPLMQTHDLAELRIVEAVGKGKPAEAIALADKLLRADLMFLGSTRSLIGTIIASKNAEASMRLAGFAVDAVPTDAPLQEGELSRNLTALSATLESATGNDWSMSRAIKGEYLVGESAITTLGAQAAGSGGMAQYLFDRKNTIELLQPYYVALNEAAETPAGKTPPPSPRFTGEGMWWAYNPTGKYALDMMMVEIGPRIADFEKTKAGLLASRGDLSKRVAALHNL